MRHIPSAGNRRFPLLVRRPGCSLFFSGRSATGDPHDEPRVVARRVLPDQPLGYEGRVQLPLGVPARECSTLELRSPAGPRRAGRPTPSGGDHNGGPKPIGPQQRKVTRSRPVASWFSRHRRHSDLGYPTAGTLNPALLTGTVYPALRRAWWSLPVLPPTIVSTGGSAVAIEPGAPHPRWVTTAAPGRATVVEQSGFRARCRHVTE
jgi:hypothetical protein